jgi:phosphoenolpyruvate carboxylase
MSGAIPDNEQGVLEKDRPLQDDIRLLGQILGDTVREQDGENAFEIVEAIRRLSVAFQRKADEAAGRNLAPSSTD